MVGGLLGATAGPVAGAPPEVVTLNTPRSFPEITSAFEWETRARRIRTQVLVSAGLWPLPERPPVSARVFDRIERDGYSVEKVAFQSYPGFYVAGNLYRPLGRGRGPFPAVLNLHGHWTHGRLQHDAECSVPARCINLARQGMIAFSYDMVGYQDTFFADHPREGEPGFAFYKRHRLALTNALCELWGVNLLGLQIWNSIRALDFLESLPDVDRKRLACTGASGGGTQTFLLAAVDDRVAVSVPVNMVSHSMQGGCACENAPGLRVDFSNMEIAAAAAPRPQLLIAATGDWTRATLEIEGPAVASIYRLLGSAERLRYVRFDFGHNYNQTSREAMYAWLGRWLLKRPDVPAVAEPPTEKDPDAALRVFPRGELPADAIGEAAWVQARIADRRRQLARYQPRDRAGWARFATVWQPFWQHTLQSEWPRNRVACFFKPATNSGPYRVTEVEIHPVGDVRGVVARWFEPAGRQRKRARGIVICADASGTQFQDQSGMPRGGAQRLLAAGLDVLVIRAWPAVPETDPFANFFTTYNRTLLQQRVRDVLTVCAAARTLGAPMGRTNRVQLWATGSAGLWALLAAPAVEAVVADATRFEGDQDAAWLQREWFCPGLRALGGWDAVVALAAPRPVLIHNAHRPVVGELAGSAYRALGARRHLRVETAPCGETEQVEWLLRRR